MKGDVAGFVFVEDEWMRGRLGRLSSCAAAAAAVGVAVGCSWLLSCSCRRFFADFSSFVFFVFCDLGVLAIVSVDIVLSRWLVAQLIPF